MLCLSHKWEPGLTSYLNKSQIEESQLPALPKLRGRVYPVRPEVAPKKQTKAIEVKIKLAVDNLPRRISQECASNMLKSIFIKHHRSSQFSPLGTDKNRGQLNIRAYSRPKRRPLSIYLISEWRVTL